MIDISAAASTKLDQKALGKQFVPCNK